MNQTYPKLGERLIVSGYVVGGNHLPQMVEFTLDRLVEFIGMSTGEMEATVYSFPLPSGQGGTGCTVFRPLVESFMVGDSWSDHEHLFVVIASCKPYSAREVREFLEENLGPVIDQGYFNLQGKGGPG